VPKPTTPRKPRARARPSGGAAAAAPKAPARGAARRQPPAPGGVRTGGLRLLRGARDLARQAAGLPESTARVITAFGPLIRKFGGETHIGEAEFSRDLDRIFEALYAHPLTEKTRTVSRPTCGRAISCRTKGPPKA
jgi:hypothetical protein